MSARPTDLPDPLDPEVLEQCARTGTLDRLLFAWEGRAVDEARGAVLAALRLDLALLVAAPELLFQCVYNRVYWHDSAEAAAFYATKRSGGEAPLRAWVERWWAARRAGGAAPWARSLRPPEFPRRGALLEEYREALPAGELRFASDGRAIGVVGKDGAIAWDRPTGRRLSASAALDAFADEAAPRFELVHIDRAKEGWGHASVRDRQSGEIVLDLAIDDDSSFDVVVSLPGDEGVLIAGWYGDYDGVVCRIDPPYRSVRWCARIGGAIRTLAIDHSGGLVIAVDGAQVHLLDGASGILQTSVTLRAQSVALAPDGLRLATRRGDLLRVWDLDVLLRGSPQQMVGARDGWVGAAFSPDGLRLLTGEMLCDAHDGRLIARLDLDGPGYLEGGPPQDGRRLADGRYVEMAPLRGVCVYDTADGRRILRDSRRRYGGRDDVTIAPDGRSYVHTRSSWGDAAAAGRTLRAVDDGEALAELGPGDLHGVAFATDGRRLYVASEGELAVWSVPDGLCLRVLQHPAAVTGLAVSRDRSRVLTGASDRTLRVWDCERGELLGERPFATDEPIESSWSSQHGERRTWRASPEALARLAGWCGFAVSDHPFVARRRAGLCEIVDGDRVLVRAVTDLELVGDRRGTRWACRSEHIEIADDHEPVGHGDKRPV